MESGQSAASNPVAGAGEASTGPSPAELVQRVADEVYRLLLQDLKLERERRGASGARRVRGDGFSPGTVYAPQGRNRP